jgi:hypothetical protein
VKLKKRTKRTEKRLRSVGAAIAAVGIFVGGDLAHGTDSWIVSNLFPPPHGSVHFDVEANPDRIDARNLPVPYVLSRPIARVPAPPRGASPCEGRYQWARGLGGTPTLSTVRVKVVNDTDHLIILDQLQVKAIAAARARSGVEVTCRGQGGYAPVHIVHVDLYRARAPFVTYQLPSNERFFSFALQPSTSEPFLVLAVAHGCDCRWQLELDIYENGKPKTYTIKNEGKDGGQPFETTAALPQAAFVRLNDRWVRQR